MSDAGGRITRRLIAHKLRDGEMLPKLAIMAATDNSTLRRQRNAEVPVQVRMIVVRKAVHGLKAIRVLRGEHTATYQEGRR